MGKTKSAAKKTVEVKPTGNVADVRKFLKALPRGQSQLIILRDELYEGNWESMLEDLHDRLNGSPYVFKLVNRIEEDIKWCRELRDAEDKFKVNLAKFMSAPKPEKKRRS